MTDGAVLRPGGARGDAANGLAHSSAVELSEADVTRGYSGQDLSPGRYVAISVADTGCGMAPEVLGRIFEPFFSAKGTGRGLGLSATRGVIRAHRGGIRVESTPGAGSRFTIVLPPAGPAVAPKMDFAQSRSGDGRPTVLVIDDEAEVRDVVSDMLTHHGYQTLLAGDGTSGLELYRRHAAAVDVVILDLVMPGRSGVDVLRDLVTGWPDAKVVVSSGFGLDRGAADFGPIKPAATLRKPFSMDTLLHTLRDVLRNGGGAPSA